MAGASDALARVRAARRRLSSEGPAFARRAGDFERISITEHDGDVLRDLVAAEQARTVVEVGLAYGASSLAIAEALVTARDDGARHVIIDPYQDEFGNAGWEALAAAGVTDICRLVRDRSQLALAQLVREGLVADAAFVDGSHRFHNVFVDLYFLRELVRPGGLAVLDDCDRPSVATAVRYFEVNAGWSRERLAAGARLGAYRLPDPPVERSFEDFQPFA